MWLFSHDQILTLPEKKEFIYLAVDALKFCLLRKLIFLKKCFFYDLHSYKANWFNYREFII